MRFWFRRRASGPPKLFEATPLPIAEELKRRIREDLATVASLHGAKRTESQLQMITSSSRNTYVNAGAGSGKSTTIIHRILVLHKYLGIPLNEITVFSFTRNSTEELRVKLINELARHGVEVTEAQAKRLVRTFHSKVLEFAHLRATRWRLFDFLDSRVDGPAAEPELLGIADRGLGEKQQKYLEEAYERCWTSSAEFRSLLIPLYRAYLLRLDYEPYDKREYALRPVELAAREDFAITSSLQSLFRGGADTPIPFRVRHLETDHVFFASAHVPETDELVVYIPSSKVLGRRAVERVGKLTLEEWLRFKCRILARYSDRKLRFAVSQASLDRIFEEARFDGTVRRGGTPEAPKFDHRLVGEFNDRAIWTVFYETATFIESMALRVADLRPHAGRLEDPEEREFVRALCLFWSAFENLLAEHKLIRFATLFAGFSERRPKTLASVSESTLRSMCNVIIDEFQDISPEVVGWIQGTLRHLAASGESTSLLCVGDDYQSIYGWRGSSPHYFLRYSETFPGRVCALVMEENFRSGQAIIDAAERALRPIPIGTGRTDKRGRAMAPEPGSVSFHSHEDLDMVIATVSCFAETWLRDAPHGRGKPLAEHDKPVLVLTRSNGLLGEVDQKMPSSLKALVRTFTFHRSKGLEADYTVLVGDCAYESRFPVRNLVYALADQRETYDTAQRHEAMRLAYVALTRARRACVWFAKPVAGGVFERLAPRPADRMVRRSNGDRVRG